MKSNIINSQEVTSARSIWCIVILFVALCLVGCSSEDEDKVSIQTDSSNTDPADIFKEYSAYNNWKKFSQDNIIIIYPPNHLHIESFPEMAKVFSALGRRTSQFLNMTPPDSFVYYFYTGIGQAREITNQGISFSDGESIHFWLPTFYGPPLVKHLLYHWENKFPKHKFLWHGMVALLDGSQQNYHQYTIDHIDSGIYLPLRELVVDTTINVDTERLQSAEAASLIDYLVYIYGIEKVRELYVADGDIYTDFEEVFGTPVDIIEKHWLEFVDTFVRNKGEGK